MDVWLINSRDDMDRAYDFVGEAGVTLPVLLDPEESVYGGYSFAESDSDAYAPFLLHVLIDDQGVIRWVSFQYEVDEARTQVQYLLEEMAGRSEARAPTSR